MSRERSTLPGRGLSPRYKVARVERHAPAGPPDSRPPSRPALFALGVLGIVVAVLVAVLVEALLAGEGRVSKGFFVATAALTPVVGLGLLAQLVAALARKTSGLLRELKRFNEEMAAEKPELSRESQAERRATWEASRHFLHVLAPFVAGLALQLLVTELAAIYCIAADVDERGVAIALGAEVFALFNYLLLFNPLLSRLAGRGTRAPVA